MARLGTSLDQCQQFYGQTDLLYKKSENLVIAGWENKNGCNIVCELIGGVVHSVFIQSVRGHLSPEQLKYSTHINAQDEKNYPIGQISDFSAVQVLGPNRVIYFDIDPNLSYIKIYTSEFKKITE